MKAAQLVKYGGQEAIEVNINVAKPVANADQVLVEVVAASVNPFDWKVREGYMQEMIPLNLPATLGGDVAGVIVKVGSGVSDFAVGQEVYGQANAVSGQGSWAEFTPVKAESLAPKPTSVDFDTAAALPLTSVSAYQALVDHMQLQPGQKILIHGGAGGIGTMAIQLAKHLGAYVATTASTDDLDYVKSLGADEVIDYTNQDFSTVIKDYDAVYDTIGGETFQKSLTVLHAGGTLVSMVEQPDENLAKERNLNIIGQFTKTTTERLEAIARLVDEGVLKAHVDKIFPIDQAPEAVEYLKSGHPRGKVILKVKE